MEQVFEVTTCIIEGDPTILANGNVMSITGDDEIPNCAYIINLPQQLSHDNGVDNPGTMDKSDSNQVTMELADVSDAVAFTELRDLDNGVVTKIDSNDGNGLEDGQESKPDVSVNEVFLSFSLETNDHNHEPEEQVGDDILISLNGDKIFAPSNLRNLIHQRQPKECNEGTSVDEGEQNPVKTEEEDSSTVDDVVGECVSPEMKADSTGVDVKKEESIVVLDHCNNEPNLILIKRPVRTYSRKSKVVAEQPVPGPTRSTLPAALVRTSPVDSKMVTPPSSPVQDQKPPQIFVKTPDKLSIRIPQRKRHLVIDAQKQINNSDFKRQLSQTEDIQQTVDLGPTSKMAMKLCMTSAGIAQLFSCPGRAINNVPLSKLYSNNLVMNVDRDPYMRRRKESISLNLSPLNSNDLKIRSGEEGVSGESQSSGSSTKKRIEIGKLTANSLEQEFKCYHRTGVFKEYTSWKWRSPTKSSKRFASLSYSMLKRNRELRKERQQANMAAPHITSDEVCYEIVPKKEVCDDENLSFNVDELGSAQQSVQTENSFNTEEKETVPTSCGSVEEKCGLSMEIEIIDECKIEYKEIGEDNESMLPETFISQTLPMDQHELTVSVDEDHPCPVQNSTPDDPIT